MQALKVLVIGMAILIVAGVAVIVVTLVNRASEPSSSATVPTANNTVPLNRFNPIRLGLPRGTVIKMIDADGDRLAVHALVPGNGERVIIIDMSAGVILGTIQATE